MIRALAICFALASPAAAQEDPAFIAKRAAGQLEAAQNAGQEAFSAMIQHAKEDEGRKALETFQSEEKAHLATKRKLKDALNKYDHAVRALEVQRRSQSTMVEQLEKELAIERDFHENKNQDTLNAIEEMQNTIRDMQKNIEALQRQVADLLSLELSHG